MTIKQKLGTFVFKHLPFSRHVFDHLRLEINSIYVRLNGRVNPFYLAKKRALKQKKNILVNIGCGPYGRSEGWINLDLFPIKNVFLRSDCRKSLPLADGSAAGIHVEMFMEHLDAFDELPYFVKDCYRSLEKGGILRVIVPDASLFLKAYFSDGWADMNKISYGLEDWSTIYPTKMEALNHVFLQGYEHYGGWDMERMTVVLREGGFTQTRQVAYGEGHFPKGPIDREYHRQNGLYVEATK